GRLAHIPRRIPENTPSVRDPNRFRPAALDLLPPVRLVAQQLIDRITDHAAQAHPPQLRQRLELNPLGLLHPKSNRSGITHSPSPILRYKKSRLRQGIESP